MSTLDKDRLQQLIEQLQLAQRMGFSSSSSPTRVLLEIAIDALLQLSEAFQRPELAGERLNQDLKFLDLDKPNALGNSKSVTVGPKNANSYYSELASRVLKLDLIPFLILLKRQKYVEAFLGLRHALSILENSDEIPEESQKRKQHPKSSTDKAISRKKRQADRAQSYYRRRQRK